MTEDAIDNYREALLQITALAENSLKTHEVVFAGIHFFAGMAFDMAPDEDIAEQAIQLGIDAAKEMSANNQSIFTDS